MKRVTEIVRGELDGKQFEQVDAYGEFTNDEYNGRKAITPGAVYGYFVRLEPDELKALRKEAEEKKSSAIDRAKEFESLYDNVYPLYWGKDESLGSRINAHLRNPGGKNEGKKGTGLIRLCAYKALKGKDIAVFSICVSNYAAFEVHLRAHFPDLLKTKNSKI